MEFKKLVLGDADAQRGREPRTRSTRQNSGDRREQRVQQRRVPGMRAGQPFDLLGERHGRTLRIEALEPAHHEFDHCRGSADGCVSEPARVPAVHTPRHHPAILGTSPSALRSERRR